MNDTFQYKMFNFMFIHSLDHLHSLFNFHSYKFIMFNKVLLNEIKIIQRKMINVKSRKRMAFLME